MDITSDHKPGSAGRTRITPDSVHAGGRVHFVVGMVSQHCKHERKHSNSTEFRGNSYQPPHDLGQNQEICVYLPAIQASMEKLFAKLPPSLSKKIEESFKAKYPGLNSGVLPAIKFTHTFVSKMCKDVTLAKELRDLSLCSAIPIPEGHFAKDCKSKQGNIARSIVYQELDLDDNWDIISADFDDSSVYSISE
ncbi:hypothetical protein Tco_0204248 [Tanacetum coccineum]